MKLTKRLFSIDESTPEQIENEFTNNKNTFILYSPQISLLNVFYILSLVEFYATWPMD